jgi:ribosomal protein S18 acetylase RimI-like enzyme
MLEAAGFSPTAAEPYMMNNTRPLSDPIPASVLPDGFTIRAVEGVHEAEALGIVHSGAFGSTWTAETYGAVMRTPGFHPDRELVVVAPDGRLAAFLIYWVDTVSGSGLFEPVGCHKDFQGRGLTKALMYEGMRRMKAHGLHTAVVNNVVENPAAAGLYRSVGFTPYQGIYDYKKQIDERMRK